MTAPVVAPASFTTTASGPFVLANGGTLLLLVDGPNAPVEPTSAPVAGGDFVTVTFSNRWIENLANAQPAEVAQAINFALQECAAAGQSPAAIATVNVSGQIVVTAALATASNAGPGFLLEILPQSTELLVLGLTAQIYYPSPWPPVSVPLSFS